MLKSPFEHLHYCPRCGHPQLQPPARPEFQCPGCGFTLYFNPACAAGVFLQGPDNRLLFVRRAKDPARGKLALPGGFIDYHETAENALRRETLEEVGLELGDLRFVCSQVNQYDYRDVRYPVVDLFFAARVAEPSQARALDGVEALVWLAPADVVIDDLAFSSIRAAFLVLFPSPSPSL